MVHNSKTHFKNEKLAQVFIFIFYILFNVYIQPLGYDRPTGTDCGYCH